MNLRTVTRTGVAAVGAVVAAGTTTFMALAAGTASADEPGRCTQNVNVREEPDATRGSSRCARPAPRSRSAPETEGFVRTSTSLRGWASQGLRQGRRAAADAHGAPTRTGRGSRTARSANDGSTAPSDVRDGSSTSAAPAAPGPPTTGAERRATPARSRRDSGSE